MVVVPPIFSKFAPSYFTLGTPTADQTVGVNSAGNAWALRTPAWLDTANTFTGAATVEGAASSSAGGIHVKASGGTDRLAIYPNGSGSVALKILQGGGLVGVFTSAGVETMRFGAGRLLIGNPIPTDDATNAIQVSGNVLLSGSGGAGTGQTVRQAGQTSTTVGRAMLDIATSWIDSTDATRKARTILSAYDTAAREAIRIDATGSAAQVAIGGAVIGSALLTVNGDTIAKRYTTAPVSLTDGATIATDASLGQVFRVSPTAARAFSNPTNGVDGQLIKYEITNSGGAFTHTWGTAFLFSAGGTGPTGSASGKTDKVAFTYRSSDGKWLNEGGQLNL